MFVWADSQDADFNPNAYGFWNDSFNVRATGGSVWITSTSGTMGPHFIPGDLGWRSSCDRNLKENFTPVDKQALLVKLTRLPITAWNAKAQSADIQHIGPTAQDFHAAFGLGGDDDKSISTIDAGGVALAAIQGLNEKVEAENKTLKQEVAELKRLVHQLRAKVSGGAQ
jgi:trimeric autotransporter adhesin